MSKLIYILNGPNLNLLGKRQPEIYGSDTLNDVETACETVAKSNGLHIQPMNGRSTISTNQREKRPHQRVMPRDHKLQTRAQSLNTLKPRIHGRNIINDWERLPSHKILVIMRSVRSQNQPSPPSLHPNSLKPPRMPANLGHFHTGRHRSVTLMKHNPP